MRVTIATRHILESIPELVPAFREHADDIPEFIEIDGNQTADGIFEKELRDKFPEYWMGLTGNEWLIFVNMHKEDGGSRSSLTSLLGNEQSGVDDEGYALKSNVIDVHIKNLRQKLFALGNKHHIVTKRTWGHILEEGPDTPQSYLHKRQYNLDGRPLMMPRREKQVADDGRLIRPKWRPKSNFLNPIEFGYLKEMKMDDIPKETVAKRLALSPEEIEHPWNAGSYNEYRQRFQPLSTRSPFWMRRKADA